MDEVLFVNCLSPRARTDGLKCREETPTILTEHYKDRDDFLERRIVNYTKRVKKFGPAEGNEKPINVGCGAWECHSFQGLVM